MISASSTIPSCRKRHLNGKASKLGYQGVKDIKITKQTCKDGACTAIGQGTAYKTTVTYATGNAVAVAQEDKSSKNAVLKEINGEEYVVTYEDGSEGTVAKSALSVQK